MTQVRLIDIKLRKPYKGNSFLSVDVPSEVAKHIHEVVLHKRRTILYDGNQVRIAKTTLHPTPAEKAMFLLDCANQLATECKQLRQGVSDE